MPYLGDFKAAFGNEILTAKSFGSATLETIDLENTALGPIYQQAKTAADKKIWEIAHENPNVDFTVSEYSIPGVFTILVLNNKLSS